MSRKKTQLQQLIDKDGIEHATDRFAEIVSGKLRTKELAYKFILEELDGASQGNDASQSFARSSGIPASEYRRALENSNPKIDGPEGPQQLLLALSMQLMPNQALMAEFRCKVDDKVMKRFGLGKYATKAEPTAVCIDRPRITLTKEKASKNYTASKAGCVVKDKSTGDILEVVLNGTMFHARVLIPHRDITLPLAPWPTSVNPFQDESLFAGEGHIHGEPWSFSIAPSAPFSEIIKEVLALNDSHEPSTSLTNEPLEWVDSLIDWADRLGLEELRWEPNAHNRNGGYWVGFPRERHKVVALEGLKVDNCGLTELPKEIGNLKKLRTLWASENKLTAIPNEICSLTELEDVRFSENQIAGVPEDVGNLAKLRILDLEDNLISYVPTSIRKLRKLERLDLRRQPVRLGGADTPLTDDQVAAIVSLGDAVRW